jgi:mercuric ion transport protein
MAAWPPPQRAALSDDADMNRPAPETASIVAGAASALGASTCCVLPLVAVSVGLGGAWIAQLRELERFFPVFVGLAVAAFAYAFYRLFLRPAPCAPDADCIAPPIRRRQRIAFWATLMSAKALIVFPFVYAYLAA